MNDEELGDELCKLFDGHSIEGTINILVPALALAVRQAEKKRKDRLILFEQISRVLLKLIADTEDDDE